VVEVADACSASSDSWDAIIGVKGKADFAENWYFDYYLDIGTGESEFTWQASAGLGYQFKHLGLNFGYRYIDWEFDDGEHLSKGFSDLNFHGPYGGVEFGF
jgi:hypothetical protein